MNRKFHHSELSDRRDTAMWRLGTSHLALGAFIAGMMLWYDHRVIAIVMGTIIAIACFGSVVMIFALLAKGKESGVGLTVAYACFVAGMVAGVWGYAFAGETLFLFYIYFLESVIILVIARRSVRELREYR